jgi:hypothetical protein
MMITGSEIISVPAPASEEFLSAAAESEAWVFHH